MMIGGATMRLLEPMNITFSMVAVVVQEDVAHPRRTYPFEISLEQRHLVSGPIL